MLRIYRIDHVAQVTPDLDAQVALLRDIFGFRPTRRWTNVEQGVAGIRLAVPGTSGQDWVVLAPVGDNSPVQSTLDEQKGRPSFHHVGAEVPDLDAVRAELDKRGLPYADSGRGWIETSLTPPDQGPGVRFRLRGPGSLALVGDENSEPITDSAPGPGVGIVTMDHICQAHPDREALAEWYADLAGFLPIWKTPIDAIPDMADLVLNIPGSSVCWEIIMPRGEDSFIDRFLARNGTSVHHVTFQVADWDAARAALAAHGVEPFDDEEGVTDGAAWKHTFVHPKQTGGVLVQFFWEERPGVWVRSDKIPVDA
ncbi:MAG TPA: VOC family protein [Pseudonocardiaceae bacterium]|jgi:methylmalonyl-CoA/ethylmalonyl-CoA epimerase|nr:VOC family protein [Pseudonocardiaceae bacterium]